MRTTPVALTGAVLATTLALSACGATDDVGSTTEANSGPIRVLTYGDYTAQNGVMLQRLGAQARVKAINASGGVNGRQVEIASCDSKVDPNVLAACLRKGVSDGVVAVVGGNTVLDAVSLKILDGAGIPQIGFTPSTLEGRNSPNTLCLSAPVTGLVAGLAAVLKSDGATTISSVLPGGLAVSKEAATTFEQTARKVGANVGTSTNYPLNITDYTPVLAKATSGSVDGVGIFGIGNAFGAAIRQLTAKPDVHLSIIGLALTPEVTTGLKDLQTPVPVVDYFKPLTDTSVKGVQMFMSDMQKYEPESKNYSSPAVADWLGAYAFEQIAKSIDGPITKESLRAAQFTQTNLDTAGFTPTIDTTKRDQNGLGRCTVNPTVAVNTLKGGQILPGEAGFLNPVTNEKVS